jgi:O-antigen/teichoic acid export membrane protein
VSLTRQVIKGVLWSGASQVLRRGASLVVTVILARLLSPDALGLVALATLVIGVTNVVSDLGFSSALVQRKDVDEEHLATAWWISVGMSTTLALLLAAIAPWLATMLAEPLVAPVLRALVLAMPIGAAGQVSYVLLQRRLDFGRIASIEVTATIVGGVVGITLASLGAGVWSLVGQSLSLSATTLVGRTVAAPWRPSRLFVPSRARELSTFGLTVVGGGLINFAAANIDNALVAGALGTATLGVYALAYNLVVLPGATFGGLVSSVMFPALSKVQSDLVRFRRGYLRMLRVVSLCTLPTILGMWATAPELVTAVYGPQWQASADILRRLLMVGVLHGINVSGNVFYALGKPGVIVRWAVVSVATLTVGLGIGTRFGLTGITLAYTLVSPVVLFVPHLLANRLMHLPFRDWLRALVPSVLASCVMVGAVLTIARTSALPSSPLVRLASLVLAGAATYAVALIAQALAAGAGLRGVLSWVIGSDAPPTERPVHS